MNPRVNFSHLITLAFFFSLLMIASCSKETSQTLDQQEEQASIASSESDGESEIVFNGVFDDAMGASDEVGMAGTGIFGRTIASNPDGSLGTQRPNVCYTVTVTHPNNTPFPVRVVIDFGTGCTGPDGHTRRGKIITDYTNRLIYPGAMAVTSFDGFYIDSIHVEGTHKITNTSTGTTNRQFTVDVIDAKLSKPNGDYTKWSSHKIITQIEGLITPDFHDDVFSITGSAHGQVKRGNLLVGWESSIIEPLIKRFTCRWIVRGKIRTVRINSTPNSPWVAVLDFGNGNCDNQAVITINGRSHNITLP